MNNVTPVVLCGGNGARLWPLSRTGFPKQFLCLMSKESLFQQAALRLGNLGNLDIHVAPPIIVTGEDHRFLATEQLREIGVDFGCMLLEPIGKNTAPALTLAAFAGTDEADDPILVVTPADQTVSNSAAFTSAIQRAVIEASNGGIVILGVSPTHSETGYGYIQANQADSNAKTHTVRRFIEKPHKSAAQAYLNEGGYYWNSGIFVLRATVWLSVLEKFRPDILNAARVAWAKRSNDNKFVRPGKNEFTSIPSESIDYAVIEHCPSSDIPIKMVTLDAGWNDLGSWDAVWNYLPKDVEQNAHQGDVFAIESKNTLVQATSRLVSLVGVSNLIVVETPDAVLVADKTRSQEVKNIFTQLKNAGREEHILHRKVYRPWGWYDSIDEGDCFKVKRIQVNPGASLSLQKHLYRAEHWVVVKVTAEIINGDKHIQLVENQSTYVPLGEVHRLTNPGTIPLEIIEVQSGSYLAEEDIVRLKDNYGRSE